MTRGYRYPVESWLQSPRGRVVAERVRLHLYEDLPIHGRVPAGTWVFSDIERLGRAGLDLALRLRDALASSGEPVRILNDPRFALDRFALLAELHARGVNRFRAFRATELLHADLRYPVFLRMERQHAGALTPLLPDRAAVEAAIRDLTSVFKGHRRRDLLVVEYVDVSDRSGVYNRYTAFRVGERIVPKRVEYSRSWSVSTHRRHSDPATIQAEIDYVEQNPHADRLLPIFDLARIDYGRIDYGVREGRIHVWEINTNPMIGGIVPNRRHRAGFDTATLPSRARFHATMAEALRSIDGDGGGKGIEVRNPALLVARARAERVDYRWRTRYRRWMKGVGRVFEIGRRARASEGGE